MLDQYFPILLFMLFGLGLGALLLGIGRFVSPNRPDPEKLSPYECGFEAFEDARMKFDVRYYLVAILFILFDLEIAFLFPWATVIDVSTTRSPEGSSPTSSHGSGRGAGPSTTLPSRSKRLPWHGQAITPWSERKRVMQPRCVQTAESAYTPPGQPTT